MATKIGRIVSREEIDDKSVDKQGTSIILYGGVWFGLVVIAGGMLELLGALRIITITWDVVIGTAAVMVGLGVIITAVWINKVTQSAL